MQTRGHYLLQHKSRISKVREAEESEGTRGGKNVPGLTQQRTLELSLQIGDWGRRRGIVYSWFGNIRLGLQKKLLAVKQLSHCSPGGGQRGPKPPPSVSVCGLLGRGPVGRGCAPLYAEPHDVPRFCRLDLLLLTLSPPPPRLGFSSCPYEPTPCRCPGPGSSTSLLSNSSTSLCPCPRPQRLPRQQVGHPEIVSPTKICAT